MLFALALSSFLSAVPHSWILDAPRSARLAIPDDEVAEAPVDRLTLPQLFGEQHRLINDAPGLGGPIALLSVGGAGIFVFGGLTWFLVDATVRSRGSLIVLFTALGAIITGVVTIVALVGAIIGTVALIRANSRRDEYAARHSEVVERINAIQSGQATEPLPASGRATTTAQLALDRDLRELEESKPGLGLPIGLMSGGAGGALYALSPFLLGNGTFGLTTSSIAVYAVVGVLAAGAIVTGTILLVKRIQDRSAITAQIEARKRGTLALPPVDEIGPPPPMPPLLAPPDGPAPLPGGQPSAPPPPPSSWAPPPSPLLFSWATTF